MLKLLYPRDFDEFRTQYEWTPPEYSNQQIMLLSEDNVVGRSLTYHLRNLTIEETKKFMEDVGVWKPSDEAEQKLGTSIVWFIYNGEICRKLIKTDATDEVILSFPQSSRTLTNPNMSLLETWSPKKGELCINEDSLTICRYSTENKSVLAPVELLLLLRNNTNPEYGGR